jgi:MinD superfamily P-loop ATPase
MMSSERPAVPELVVLSGKGGTGKTSVVASFACLADGPALADCDVEAADLDLVLTPTTSRSEQFFSGRVAVIRDEDCIGCGECLEYCRFEAIGENGTRNGTPPFWIDPLSCEGCGTCVRFCPVEAIDFPVRHCGEWIVSETRRGPMVHARLRAAEGNSGRLVATVRNAAQRIAVGRDRRLVIVDGPPGIGCPAIAAITGSSLVLVVTEPTPSGEHDLTRVIELTRHFGIPTAVCVNKWDLNPSMTQQIESRATASNATVAGRITYDGSVSTAQLHARAVVESDGAAAREIRELWERVREIGATHGVAF